MQKPNEIIDDLFSEGKGILAADESVNTMNKRLIDIGVEPVEYYRLLWRHILFSKKHLNDYVSGVILSEDIFDSSNPDGKPFYTILKEHDIHYGIKVDKGLKELDSGIQNEFYTSGLQELPDLVEKAKRNGATFTKWRSVFTIGPGSPTDECLRENIEGQADYAKIVNDAGLVPIIEPEVLRDGDHSTTDALELQKHILENIVTELDKRSVPVSEVIFKIAFVTAGADAKIAHFRTIAQATAQLISESLPDSTGGVVFLSGGLPAEFVNTYLNSVMSEKKQNGIKPPITFSFGRSLQQDALRAWHGMESNINASQEKFSASLAHVQKALSEY